MTSALTAVFLVAPQPGYALGGELIALAAVSGAALYVFDRRGGHDQASRVPVTSSGRHRTRSRPVFFAVAGITFLSPPAVACTG